MVLKYQTREKLWRYPPLRHIEQFRWWIDDRLGSRGRTNRFFTVKIETTRYNDHIRRWAARFDIIRDRFRVWAIAIALLSMVFTASFVGYAAYYLATVPLPPLPTSVSAGQAVVALGVAIVLTAVAFFLYTIANNIIVLLLLPAVLAHEIAHGVVAEAEGYEVQTLGLYFIGPLLVAAYCDIYDPEWRSRRPTSEMLVYSAGPIANFILAGLLAVVGLLGLAMAGDGLGYWAALGLLVYAGLNVGLAVTNMIIFSWKIDGGGATRGFLDSRSIQTRQRLKRLKPAVRYGILTVGASIVLIQLGWV